PFTGFVYGVDAGPPREADDFGGDSGAIVRGLSRLRPELFARPPRAFGERSELHPDNLGIDLHPSGEGAKAAVDAGDDIVPADHAGEIDDTVGDYFGMLHRVDGRIDDAGNDF